RPRIRPGTIDLTAHRHRLGEDLPLMLHRRQRAAGIAGEIFGRVMLEFRHVDIMIVEVHTLLLEREQGLARIGIRLPRPDLRLAHPSSPRLTRGPVSTPNFHVCKRRASLLWIARKIGRASCRESVYV